MCRVFQRPFAESAANIGAWQVMKDRHGYRKAGNNINNLILYAPGMEFGASSFCPICDSVCLSLCGKKL